MPNPVRVTLLCGGFGGARMAHGFALLGDAVDLTVIGNTADDFELHGLHISPDLDTIMYTLAGIANAETGWGVRDETWSAADMLERFGEPTWFRLGDRDLATHVVRTARLRAGARLTTITGDLARALGVRASTLPMTDDAVRTKIRTHEGWLAFQDYFVRRRHADEVLDIAFDGITVARPTPEALAAVQSADLIVVAPSNPFVSVAPILALDGMLAAMRAASATTIAVSPLIGGTAVRGPADRMLRSLGGSPGAAGVARLYAERYPGLIDLFVVHESDASSAAEIATLGMGAATADILIADEASRRRLAADLLELGRRVTAQA